MSELAFNQNGDLFDVPAVVTGWRVRRLKPRGAPELVYGRDGRPLTISIEADMSELRHAVGGVLGKYRLDPIDEDGKLVDATQPAYVQVVKAEQPADAVATATPRDDGDNVLREAMRLNTELAKSIVDRFPEMMQSAAELLRAADGAGLPARQPRAIDLDDEEEDDETADARGTRGDALNALVAQVVPMLVTALCGGKLDLASLMDWRKAQPQPACAKPAPRATKGLPSVPAAKESTVLASEAAATETAMPAIDPQTMAHVVAIQSELTAEEVALVQTVAKDLSPAELRAWFDDLSTLSVPDAVAKIRALVTGKGGAS
jgi:hypothetical protein